MWMHGERPAEELGGFTELAERQMAESLTGQGAEVIGITGERLPAVGDRRRILSGHVANRRPLVPPLGEGRRLVDQARERRIGGHQVLTLHGLDPLAQQAVEPGVTGAVPHLPEDVRGARRLRHIVASKSRQGCPLGHELSASRLRATRDWPPWWIRARSEPRGLRRGHVRARRSLYAPGIPEHKGSTTPPRKDDAVTGHIAEARVRVDCAANRGSLRRIWTSFGYDEINWTYTPAGRRALEAIGSFVEQPYYVRSHYIFNSGIGWSLPHMGAGNVYHEDAAGRPFYDFTIADQVYDAVVEAGLRPLVELAFTPRALVPDGAEARFPFEPSPTQWSPYEAGLWSFPPKDYAKWAGLVRALVEHCVARYRAPHVRGWLWELWNEPDITYWRGTPEEFYALYDVTAAAVKAALPEAAVGGPATTGDLGPGRKGNEFLRGFLAHCAKTSAPLDFVAFHTKGARFSPWRVYGPLGGPAPERQSPSSLKMLREVRTALDAVETHPRFRDLPCIVDECDASVPAHWGFYDNANFAYRNTAYFPVFQCKLMKKLLDTSRPGGAHVD